jgi:hypothetical protein
LRAEREEFGFRRLDFQTELSQALRQFTQESPRVGLCLKADNKSSSPGESHPQALTEPDVNLSAHPALIVQPQDEFRFAKAQTSLVLGGQHYPTSEQLVEHGERNA